jgi:hypothetical protein
MMVKRRTIYAMMQLPLPEPPPVSASMGGEPDEVGSESAMLEAIEKCKKRSIGVGVLSEVLPDDWRACSHSHAL